MTFCAAISACEKGAMLWVRVRVNYRVVETTDDDDNDDDDYDDGCEDAPTLNDTHQQPSTSCTAFT